MARNGYHSLTLKDDVYEKLEAKSQKKQLSISKTIDFLLENCKEA